MFKSKTIKKEEPESEYSTKTWRLMKWFIWISTILCFAAFLALAFFARDSRDAYRPNVDQYNKVWELQESSKDIMPILQTNKTHPDIGDDITNVIKYYVKFKYIPDEQFQGKIDYYQFNAAVFTYLNWSELERQNYVNVVNNLYSHVIYNENVTPEVDQYKIENFAYYLKDITMDTYADIDKYEAASNIVFYTFIPFGVWVICLTAYTWWLRREVTTTCKQLNGYSTAKSSETTKK